MKKITTILSCICVLMFSSNITAQYINDSVYNLNQTVLDYSLFQELADSSFFKSDKVKYVLATNIPDTVTYKDILDIYQIYSNKKGKQKRQERDMIFNHLLAKNWKILWGKSILTYQDMVKWREYQTNIIEDSTCRNTLVLYNKSALLLQDSENPNPNKFMDLNEFSKFIEIISIKIEVK